MKRLILLLLVASPPIWCGKKEDTMSGALRRRGLGVKQRPKLQSMYDDTGDLEAEFEEADMKAWNYYCSTCCCCGCCIRWFVKP